MRMIQLTLFVVVLAAALPVDMEPWRHAKVASAAIVIATLAFYIALAQ